MKIDLYTRTILTVIAICLTIITLQSVELAPKALAADKTKCKGELTANAWGGIEPGIGGYEIELECK